MWLEKKRIQSGQPHRCTLQISNQDNLQYFSSNFLTLEWGLFCFFIPHLSLPPFHSFSIYILGPSVEHYFALLILSIPKYTHLWNNQRRSLWPVRATLSMAMEKTSAEPSTEKTDPETIWVLSAREAEWRRCVDRQSVTSFHIPKWEPQLQMYQTVLEGRTRSRRQKLWRWKITAW